MATADSKKKLGLSLQSLLGEAIGLETKEGIAKLKVSEIQANESQPRKHFGQDQIETLASSIQEHGVLQPIIVRSKDKGYSIIAGERRWRAAKLLGLDEIPAIIKKTDNLKSFELALVENIQREDLNPIEKAHAYLELKNEFGLTQAQIAAQVGQDRSSIANTLRLLDLPEEIQDFVSRGTISMGHARALLTLKDEEKQRSVCEKIVTLNLSVREVELLVSGRGESPHSSPDSHKNLDTLPSHQKKLPQIVALEDRLREYLGAKISIKENKGKGKIVIEFSSSLQFEELVAKFRTLAQ
ncbi:MAG: ParB/RepB/Spo0J family partition protein [Candidatus Scalindua sp.]|nr:ParB/RepB/Spo0J family partition protein [Candidatus Scalindua sp.]